jgi:hypothetical protein
MRRQMSLDPELRPREILGSYLAHFPERSYEGSYVFHAEKGCTLPRHLRADICNQHYCGGLIELKSRLDSGAATRAMFGAAYVGREELRAVEIVDGASNGLRTGQPEAPEVTET